MPQLAGPALAAPPGVDDDVSVAAREVPVTAEEPNAAETDTAMNSSEAVEVVWPEPGSAVVEVPVALGRATPSELAPTPAVSGVSVLVDGAATGAVRPGDGLEPDRAGPGRLPLGAPAELGGLAAGGLAQVRLAGHSRAAAGALGAAQVFSVERVDGSPEPAAVDVCQAAPWMPAARNPGCRPASFDRRQVLAADEEGVKTERPQRSEDERS